MDANFGLCIGVGYDLPSVSSFLTITSGMRVVSVPCSNSAAGLCFKFLMATTAALSSASEAFNIFLSRIQSLLANKSIWSLHILWACAQTFSNLSFQVGPLVEA